MIKEEKITLLEKTLRLPEGSLKAAITDEKEVDIELPTLKVYTEEEENTRIENVRKEAKTAGVEMAVKEARNKLGLQFEGKTIDNLLEHHSKKVLADAKIEPEKKVKELQDDNEKLRTNLTQIQTDFDNFKLNSKKERDSIETENVILSKIPQNTLIPQKDVLTVFKANFGIEKDETGNIVFKKNNEVLKNKTTLSPLTLDEVMNDFITPYIKPVQGGAGGGDDTGKDKPGSIQAFQKEMEEKGIAAGSVDFNKEMNKRLADKTLVI